MYKKERNYLKNLSHNEFDQIEKMRGLSPNQLEQNANINAKLKTMKI